MKKYFIVLFSSVVLQMTMANTPPKTKNDTLHLCSSAGLDTFHLLANDSDAEGDSLYIASTLITGQHGTYSFIGGKLVYAPHAGYRGSDKFYLKICDNGSPSLCSHSFVFITIDTCLPENGKPVATFDSVTACRNQTQELNVLNNDTDPENHPLRVVSIWNYSPNGFDSISNGSLYYRPNLGFTGTDYLTYVVCDSPGTGYVAKCDTQDIVILVTNCGGTNNPPIAQIDVVPGVEDFPIGFPFDPRDNDSDPDGDNLTWTAVLGPFNGTVSPFGNKWVYRPNANFSGIDFMYYRLCDDGLPQRCTPLLSPTIVTFVIANVNDPPVANRDTFTIYEDESITMNVLANDVDVDFGTQLQARLVSLPSHGKLVANTNNTFTYSPNENYFGKDGFTYEACDSFTCRKANVLINILPVNDPPMARPDTVWINSDAIKILEAKKLGIDVDGDSLFFSTIDTGSCTYASSLDDIGSYLVKYLPNATHPCQFPDILYYTICDVQGACASSYIVVYESGYGDTDLQFPEGISPNGDGINDKLVIGNIENYRPALLRIFNRYGYPIYESDDYQNDWAGRDIDHDNDLPDGPYWYILQLPEGKKYIHPLQIYR